MPKVIVQGSKGLYQQSGSGFSFADNQVEPSLETLTNQHIDMTFSVGGTAPADNTEWMNGYFLLYSSTAEYVVWFNMDTVATSSNGAQPTVTSKYGYPQVFIEVEPAGATIDNVCDALETALSATGVPFKAYNDGSGVMEIVGDTPYANLQSADIGSFSSTVITAGPTQTSTGSGSGTKAIALDKEITVISPCNPDAAVVDTGSDGAAVHIAAGGKATGEFTLADGTFVGQKKKIIIPMGHVMPVLVKIDNLANPDQDATSTGETLTSTTGVLSIIDLMWSGAEWANVTQAAFQNISGQTT